MTRISYAPPPIRSRDYRRLHDCLFIPNIEEVIELADARRLILALDSAPHTRGPSRHESRFASPLAIGLMLAFVPPLAVSLVWSSRHFTHSAKVAITAYGMFTFVALLMAIVAIVHG